MMPLDDIAMLQEYARTGAEDAFATLVRRHAGLVYSAARRQVWDPQHAQDVTQTVFIILARKAKQVARHPGLSGWLLLTTRYAANAHLRASERRAKRELEAAMRSELNDSSSVIWAQIEPHLDEAMAALGATDRAVLAMRYFENKTAAEIGQALKLSEEAAKKRATRALEKLRSYFAKKGVAPSAAAIAAALSAKAVQAAPPALAASIVSAALTGTSLSLSTFAMTIFQKFAVTAALTVVIGGGIYAARQAADARAEAQRLLAQQAAMSEQIQQLQTERDNNTNLIAALKGALSGNDNNNSELLRLRGEVSLLRNALTKQAAANTAPARDTSGSEEQPYTRHARLLIRYFEEHPNARIPEMALLPREKMHFESIYGLAVKLAAQNGPALFGQQGVFDEPRIRLEADEEYRRAASELRSYAEYSIAPMLCSALQDHLQANSGAFPASISDLRPFLTNSIDDAVLQRYEIQPASHFAHIQTKYADSVRISGSVLTPRAAVDEEFDHRIIIGPTNHMVGDVGSFKP